MGGLSDIAFPVGGPLLSRGLESARRPCEQGHDGRSLQSVRLAWKPQFVGGRPDQACRQRGWSGSLPGRDRYTKGANFKRRIQEELGRSDELIAFFTPWSSRRSWLWMEIGAAFLRGIPIVAVFYGLKPNDLEESGQGKAILEDINLVELNSFDDYLVQLKGRIQGTSP